MIINLIIKDSFFIFVDFRMSFLKCFFGILLRLNFFSRHSNFFILIFLMIQEVIWALELIQININILPVFNILSNLMYPFLALHIIHEFFTVTIIKQNSNLGLLFVLKVKPKFLDFNSLIIHIFSQIFHSDLCLNWIFLVLRIDNFDDYEVFILYFELETLIENGIVFWLWLCSTDIFQVEFTTHVSFNLYRDVWS